MSDRSYSVDPELMHYGVKGMKWKNHKYSDEYLKGGAQRRQTNSGYGVSDHVALGMKQFRRKELGKDYDKYTPYIKYTPGKRMDDDDLFETTYVKNRTKNKRLVTKTKTIRDKTYSDWPDPARFVDKKVDPGRYNSYKDAVKGETKRATRNARAVANKMEKQTSNTVSKLKEKTSPYTVSKLKEVTSPYAESAKKKTKKATKTAKSYAAKGKKAIRKVIKK